MGRLRRLSGRAVCDIPARHGFVEKRRKVSHVVMQKQADGSTVTVPLPLHDELRIGTLLSIIRQSRISCSEFES